MRHILWGTGLSGKINLDFLTRVNKFPDYICCNDSKLWGKMFYGIKIISPEQLKSYIKTEQIFVYIASYAYFEIKEQLLSIGLDENHILRAQFPYYNTYKREYDFLLNKNLPTVNINTNRKKGYIFDLYVGTSLGGVASWVYSQQKIFQKNNIDIVTILPSDVIYKKENITGPSEIIERSEKNGLYEGVLAYLLTSDYSSFINMTICESFVASCKAKAILGDHFTNIVVVHGDFEPYYMAYANFEKYIDFYLVISERIYQRFLELGIPKNKIVKLEWNVDFNFDNRKYSPKENPLQITYFGRLTVGQKRCDLLIPLVKKLNEIKVNYILNIAGSGTYEAELKDKFRSLNLKSFVNFVGEIKNCDVESYLEKQDIFISCTEYEGHTIAQYEAIGCGCVPVVTDVSGASDDIEEGYNGYIVKIGDIEDMSKKIKKLDDDRALLEIMGLRGRNKIIKNNLKENALLKIAKEKVPLQK